MKTEASLPMVSSCKTDTLKRESPQPTTNHPPIILLKIVHAIDGISKWTGHVACLLIVPLFLAIAGEVIWRFLFGRSLYWSYDMTYMLYGAFFMLGASYTLSMGGHIRSDFLYCNFPTRVKAAIDLVAYLLIFIPIISLLGWYGFESALSAWKSGERAITSAWMPQLYPFKAVIPLTAALLVLQAISEVLKSGYSLFSGEEI